jgi:hypothetical protein
MTTETCALLGPSPTRDTMTNRIETTVVPVLIQVPALSASARRAALRPVGRRRRRRLRREVRVAGSALLFGVPLAWGLLAFWGGRPDAVASTAPCPPDYSAVSISLDVEAPPRVVLEDVVPDIGCEETVHAGG